MRDVVGADDPGDADVDHMGVDDVQRDPSAGQDDGGDREPPDRNHRDQRPVAIPRPDAHDHSIRANT